jgi:hypothetical protein
VERATNDVAKARALESLHTELERDYPREWLLRWNLLEKAQHVPAAASLAQRLADELEVLELAFDRREPIALGLKYLRERR